MAGPSYKSPKKYPPSTDCSTQAGERGGSKVKREKPIVPSFHEQNGTGEQLEKGRVYSRHEEERTTTTEEKERKMTMSRKKKGDTV